MKNAMKALQQTHRQANEVANAMRSHRTQNESIAPSWLVDIYKKSGIASVVVSAK